MEIIGFLVFGLIKYFGYFFYLKMVTPKDYRQNLYFIALVRLIAGLVVGMSIYAAFTTGRNFLPAYFSAILIGRLALWYLVFQIFYKILPARKKILLATGGTLVSYILDIPSSFGLWVIIGGIC